MIVALCLLVCVASMPLTWRLCFPPFPQFKAADPVAPDVPNYTYDSWGLV